MNRFLSILFALVMAISIIIGCSDSTGRTIFPNDDFSNRPLAKPIPLEASVENGLLSWKVELVNNQENRGYFLGTIDFVTEAEAITVEFDLTVPGNKTLVVEDKFKCKGKNLISRSPRVTGPTTCVTCTCPVNCGGKKCKGVAANWTPRELKINYVVKVLAPTAIITKNVGEVTSGIQVKYDEYDATRFSYIATIYNNTTEEVVVDFTILVDGKATNKDHTVGVASFKSTNREGVYNCNVAKPHEFKVHINKVTIMGK